METIENSNIIDGTVILPLPYFRIEGEGYNVSREKAPVEVRVNLESAEKVITEDEVQFDQRYPVHRIHYSSIPFLVEAFRMHLQRQCQEWAD